MKTIVATAVFMVLLLPAAVHATEIAGRTFGPDLEPLQKVVVEITTEPRQIVVSDPSYTFSVSPGTYLIQARYENGDDLFLEENITVRQEGRFSHDLILFYRLDPGVEVPEPVDLPWEPLPFSPLATGGIAVVVLIAVMIVMVKGKKRCEKESARPPPQKTPETKEDLKPLLDALQQQGGRMNQKDLRKHLGLSEAKMSLMLAELEGTGKVKRIRRGRANVVVAEN